MLEVNQVQQMFQGLQLVSKDSKSTSELGHREQTARDEFVSEVTCCVFVSAWMPAISSIISKHII